MARSSEPVVLELAALPREQMGPFLILGLDKSAGKKAIEEHWADRLKWARRNQVKVALEDINWARETLKDNERRIKFDAASINVDSTDGVMAELSGRYGLEGGQAARMWQPLDSEKDLAEYSPAADVPSLAGVKETIRVPEVPEEMPAALVLLEQLTQQALDPWAVELPPSGQGG
jgi:hypothetical protein